MYLNFYQLSKKPFSLAPDPEFLYLSQQHKDALGAIIYGIKEREGFVSVIGEVGTGKTTIVKSYLHKTDRNKILPIFIFNSKITFPELMKTFLYEIGIESDLIQRSHNVNDMVRLAYQAMLKKTRQGKNLVLIIDEAQNMPLETLGNLCILSNFETTKTKLIQIVLVGQPELQKKLALYELRQLRQRIAYRAWITPLSIKESIDYFCHRLSLTSSGQRPVFTPSAIRRIVMHSKGVPRVINILGENSLVAGYGLQKKPVSLTLVKQVIAEYEGKRFSGRLQFKTVTGSTLIVLLATFLAATYLPSPFLPTEEPVEEQVRFKIPSTPDQQPVMSNDKTVPSNETVVKQIEDKNQPPEQKTLTIPTIDESNATNFSAGTYQPQPSQPLDTTHLPDISRDSSSSNVNAEENVWSKTKSTSSLFAGKYMTSDKSSPLKIVKRGDTISNLCLDKYGFYNTQVLLWLKTHNPHIPNMDELEIDEIIFFPEMEPTISLYMPQRINNRSRTTKEEVVLR